MEATSKQFRKRNAILTCLRQTCTHPSAEDVHRMLQAEHPDISLATVYRNLKLLESEGLILKITTGDSDRFDGHTHSHYHFTCNDCMKVLDLEIADTDFCTLPRDFDGVITGHSLMFFGLCSKCKK